MVYFAKAPVPGQVKTRLCPPLMPEEAAAVYKAFLDKIVRPHPGVRTLVYGWPGEDREILAEALPAGWEQAGIELRDQQGDDLWGRMRHCFEELFSEGHSPVLIRNTDSPDLDPALVTTALEKCCSGRVVLGPDTGGGYYLIALAEPRPELLGGSPEGADTVFAQTAARVADLGLELVELSVQPDVDTFEDLLALWRAR